MSNNKYKMPLYQEKAFICPHCGAYARQDWSDCYNEIFSKYDGLKYERTIIANAKCDACGKFSVWLRGDNKNSSIMIYPDTAIAPMPNNDMPENVKELYNEARDIVNKSPRGATALLRLALDKLCDEICSDCKQPKYNGKISDKIGLLVANGLSDKLQQAFDFVRVTGNDAVHELGLIDVKDNPEIANALFGLLNFIVEKMITENKQIDDLYNLIPKSRRDKIEERNKKVKGAVNNA